MNCALCGAPEVEDGGLCPACDRLSSFFTLTLDRVRDTTGPLQGEAAKPAFAPGHAFGDRYTIVELVGAGGMGQVYKALDKRLNRTVALKLIRPGLQMKPASLQRFRRELTLAQQVSHPNVCRLHDLGEVDGALYISMEFIHGQALEDLMRSMGHLSPRQTITLGRQICAGLSAVHARDIVHRDLKPGNVMVDRTGHAVLMDFGMAYHPGDEKLTSEGSVLGTLAYLSPEHARGQTVDVRSDIYTLGVILYEMLTGRRPPGDDGPLPLALREVGERCPRPSEFTPEVPAVLDTIVLRSIERDPARRFATAAELEQALAQAAGALSTTLLPAVTPSPARLPSLHLKAVVVLALAGALGMVALASRQCTPAPPPRAGPRVLALLPLAYDGPADRAWLKDVLPKAVGDGLRGLPKVEVVPFASSRSFGPSEDPRSVARSLGVTEVVQGRLVVEGDRADVELALWSDEGRPTWSKARRTTLDRVLVDAAAMASDLAAAMGLPRSTARSPIRDPRALEAYLRGQSLLEGWDVESNYSRAEEAFRDAVRIEDNFAEAHAGVAAALWRRYQQTLEATLVEPAIAEAQRAISLSPSLPEAHLALGVIQLGRGRSAEAAASFEEARRLAPADDAACRQIARAYAAQKRYDEADKVFREAIDLRPEYWENYNARASFCLRTGRLKEAKELFQKVIDLRSLSPTGYSNKASVHIMEGEFKEAEPLLRAAAQLGSGAAARTNLGFVLYALGRYAEAAAEYRAAIDGGSSRAEAYGGLGDACRQGQRAGEAQAAYSRAVDLARARLEVNPSDTSLRAGLAMFLAGSGQCRLARREAEKAVAGPSHDAIASYYASIASGICRDLGRAREHLLSALDGGIVLDVRTNPDLAGVRRDAAIRKRLGVGSPTR